MKISVFGTGYIGLVTGVCFAEIGQNMASSKIIVNKSTVSVGTAAKVKNVITDCRFSDKDLSEVLDLTPLTSFKS